LANDILKEPIQYVLDNYVVIDFEEVVSTFYFIWHKRVNRFIPERIGEYWNRDKAIEVLAVNFPEKNAY